MHRHRHVVELLDPVQGSRVIRISGRLLGIHEDLEAVRKSGKTEVYTPTAEELAAFHKALAPVHKQMEGRIGKDMVKAAQDAAGFSVN